MDLVVRDGFVRDGVREGLSTIEKNKQWIRCRHLVIVFIQDLDDQKLATFMLYEKASAFVYYWCIRVMNCCCISGPLWFWGDALHSSFNQQFHIVHK